MSRSTPENESDRKAFLDHCEKLTLDGTDRAPSDVPPLSPTPLEAKLDGSKDSEVRDSLYKNPHEDVFAKSKARRIKRLREYGIYEKHEMDAIQYHAALCMLPMPSPELQDPAPLGIYKKHEMDAVIQYHAALCMLPMPPPELQDPAPSVPTTKRASVQERKKGKKYQSPYSLHKNLPDYDLQDELESLKNDFPIVVSKRIKYL